MSDYQDKLAALRADRHKDELNAARAEAVLAFAEWSVTGDSRAQRLMRAEAFLAAQGWLPQEPKEGQ